MTGRLFNLVTALSLLLCAALTAQAGRSLVRSVGRFHLDSGADKLLSVDPYSIRVEWREERDHSRWRYFAVSDADRVAEVQTWWVILLLAALPAVRGVRGLRRQMRSKRIAAGLCHHCGYNLTGNVSGVCPECGGWAPR